jgi:hypothetical protein
MLWCFALLGLSFICIYIGMRKQRFCPVCNDRTGVDGGLCDKCQHIADADFEKYDSE